MHNGHLGIQPNTKWHDFQLPLCCLLSVPRGPASLINSWKAFPWKCNQRPFYKYVLCKAVEKNHVAVHSRIETLIETLLELASKDHPWNCQEQYLTFPCNHIAWDMHREENCAMHFITNHPNLLGYGQTSAKWLRSDEVLDRWLRVKERQKNNTSPFWLWRQQFKL